MILLSEHFPVCSPRELSLWDLSDGRCLEHKKSEHTHTHMTAYPLMQARGELRLVCHGYYADIDVLDPLTLEPLFCLAARIQPDWISALCVLRPVKKEGEGRRGRGNVDGRQGDVKEKGERERSRREG